MTGPGLTQGQAAPRQALGHLEEPQLPSSRRRVEATAALEFRPLACPVYGDDF